MALDVLPKNRWSPELAAHLLNRAGFGGSPSGIDTFYQLGHAGAVARLLDIPAGTGRLADPAWANAMSARRGMAMDGMRMRDMTSAERENVQRIYRQLEQARMFDLRAWWLYRMRNSPHPLQEKMTLFLHGHFATGFEKVQNAYAMFLQNQTFRRNAAGNWRTLLEQVTRDPAMLVYLDGIENTRQAPNENYAREVMELFTLGEGHYSENDIREAARAYTGWQFNRREFAMAFVASRYDAGRKSFMGRKGNFTADEIIGIILEQKQAARWLAAKLWTFFAYENPEPDVVDDLADILRRNKYELKPALEAIFMSRAFYGSRAYRRQVKGPVQWLVGTMVYMEMPMPDPSASIPLLASLGQSLFDPPNVKGWDGGVTWITTSSLALRYEATSRFAGGQYGQRARDRMEDRRDNLQAEARRAGMEITLPDESSDWLKPLSAAAYDGTRLFPEEARESREEIQRRLLWRMYQSDLREQDRQRFSDYYATLPEPAVWKTRDFRDALIAMTNTPQYQLT